MEEPDGYTNFMMFFDATARGQYEVERKWTRECSFLSAFQPRNGMDTEALSYSVKLGNTRIPFSQEPTTLWIDRLHLVSLIIIQWSRTHILLHLQTSDYLSIRRLPRLSSLLLLSQLFRGSLCLWTKPHFHKYPDGIIASKSQVRWCVFSRVLFRIKKKKKKKKRKNYI